MSHGGDTGGYFADNTVNTDVHEQRRLDGVPGPQTYPRTDHLKSISSLNILLLLTLATETTLVLRRHQNCCLFRLQLNLTQRASMDAGVKHLDAHVYLVTTV